MRLNCKSIKKLILMCSAMFFLVAVHILSVYVFAAHRFTVSYDAKLSPIAQDLIDKDIQLSHLFKESPSLIIEALRQNFPFIRHIGCAYTPSGLHIDIKAYRPVALVSDNRCVTKNNRCVPTSYFTLSYLKELPTIEYAMSKEMNILPEDMFAYLVSIESFILKNNIIRWRHHNEIICDVYDRSIRLICNYEKKPTLKLLEQCRHIAAELNERDDFVSGFCADARFNDRIIISKLRNEEVYS